MRKATQEEATARHEYVRGVSVKYYVNQSGDGSEYWCVSTRYDPMLQIMSSWVVAEPEILRRMAESFRSFGVTATGKTLEDAIREAYRKTALVGFENAFYRKDVGARALAAEKD